MRIFSGGETSIEFRKTVFASDDCYLSHLQCTTMGPASSWLAFDEFRTKVTRGRAWRGTPWSGHAVKWYCGGEKEKTFDGGWFCG